MAKKSKKKKEVVHDSSTVKMTFNKDMFFQDRNVPLYRAGQVYTIPSRNVAKWLKRGGVIVTDQKPVESSPEKVEDKIEI